MSALSRDAILDAEEQGDSLLAQVDALDAQLGALRMQVKALRRAIREATGDVVECPHPPADRKLAPGGTMGSTPQYECMSCHAVITEG